MLVSMVSRVARSLGIRSQPRLVAIVLLLVVAGAPGVHAGPGAVDTDEDGVPDNLELAGGTDPLRADTDEDGLTDGEERSAVRDEPFDRPIVLIDEIPHSARVLGADIDGDGDRDVVVTADVLQWIENDPAAATEPTIHPISALGGGANQTFAVDIDRDGDIDLVTPQYHHIAWYENLDGLGTFDLPHEIATTEYHLSLHTPSDLDGDGDLDLIVVSGQGAVIWRENDLPAATWPVHEISRGEVAYSHQVSPADIDGDSDVDLVMVDRISGDVVWRENEDGEGQFGSLQILHVWDAGRSSSTPSVFDVDCDDDLDIVVTHGTTYVLENLDGMGDFAPVRPLDDPAHFAVNQNVADFDSDGDLDLLARGDDGAVAWLVNDGAGNFTLVGSNGRSGYTFILPEIVDWDGDGNLDVVGALRNPNGGLQSLTFFRNPGSDPTVTDTEGDGLDDYLESQLGTNPGLLNTDGDGVSDAYEVSVGRDPLVIEGPFTDSDHDGLHEAGEAQAGTDPLSLDTDDDGLLDGFEVRHGFDPLVAGEESQDPDGDGLTNLEEQAQGTDPYGLDSDADGIADDDEVARHGTDPFVADSDGDGLDDGAELSRVSEHDMSEWVSITSDSFQFGIGITTSYFVPGDFDGDGHTDFAYFDVSGRSLAWVSNLGTGDGRFSTPRRTHAEFVRTFARVFAVDIDRDGDLDLVGYPIYIDPGFGGLALFENIDGAGMFAEAKQLSEGMLYDSDIAFFDFDGDGDLDVVHGLEWLPNLGAAGNFGAPISVYPETDHEAVRVADVDGDGDADLIVSDLVVGPRGAQQVMSWLENRGVHSSFALHDVDPRDHASGCTSDRLVAYDFDDDADVDIVCTVVDRDGQDGLVLYENFGLGVFSVPRSIGSERIALVAADFDQDGRQELVTSKSNPPPSDLQRIEFGDSGVELIEVPVGDASSTYFQSTVAVADLDGDGDEDLVLHAGGRGFGFLRNPGTSPLNVDTDNDGLSDGYEVATRTDPTLRDTDGDGLTDGFERSLAFDPLAKNMVTVDLDGDGLLVIEENLANTSALDVDTDDDGLADRFEVDGGLDPNMPDAQGDLDEDGLSNEFEQILGTHPGIRDTDRDALSDYLEATVEGTDPSAFDTDGDGIGDGEEVLTTGTNPLLSDTDEDGLADGYERAAGLDPLTASDTAADSDGDGLDHLSEQAAGTDPLRSDSDRDGLLDGEETSSDPALADTDRDGLLDGFEVAAGLDAVGSDDASGDPDADQLTNLAEQAYGTDPHQSDSDADGLSDGEEVATARHQPLQVAGTLLSYSMTGINSFSFVDLDGDGLRDLISGGGSGGVLVWLRNLGGYDGFVRHEIPLEAEEGSYYDQIGQVIPGDVDGDGDTDLITVLRYSSVIQWIENMGDGEFGSAHPILDTGSSASLIGSVHSAGTSGIIVRTSDLDADGDLDLVVPFRIYRRDHVVLIENLDGAGSFAPPVTILGTFSERVSLSVGDVDDDGLDDLVIGSDRLAVYLNRARGKHFEAVELDGGKLLEDNFSETLYGQVHSSTTLADFDHDGDLDLGFGTLATGSTGRAGWIENLGDGEFGAAQDLSGSGDPGGFFDRVIATDVDADADLDFVTFGESRHPIWYENVDGHANFGAPRWLVETIGSRPSRPGLHAIAADLLPGQGNEILLLEADGALRIFRDASSPDPALADTDGNGVPDGWEVMHGFDPAVIEDRNVENPDDDWLDLAEEYEAGTDPRDSDTDDDGLSDSREVGNNPGGTDPTDPDTDGDGLLDGEEYFTHRTDPQQADTDNDGLSDGDEVGVHGTDALDADTDDDGLPDGYEVANALNALEEGPENAADVDGDGLTTLEEFEHGSDLLDSDSDDDGLTDGEEVHSHQTDPMDADTDGDGRSDGDEILVFATDPRNPDITPAMTTITPPGGAYAIAQSVRLRCADEGAASCGGAIYYTIDGSDPTTDSLVYSGVPLSIAETTTVKYHSIDLAGNAESIRTARYVIKASAHRPSAVELLSPDPSEVGLGTTLEFVWLEASDPNGDELEYELFICENEDFVGCESGIVAAVQSLFQYAGVGGPIQALALSMLLVGCRRRPDRWVRGSTLRGATIALAAIVVVGLGSGCRGGGSNSDAEPARVSRAVAGLNPGTTYYWKVTASDGVYTAESQTRSFTTQ